MDLNQATPPHGRVFTFTEKLEGGTLQAHSYGDGRFIQGSPSECCEISFSLYKADENSLSIQIYDDDLLKWLCTIPNLCGEFDENALSISMNALLPCYPDVRERFAQYEREGHGFDAVELFVRHFLREGSVFATFGLEHLSENGILTDLHFHDIQSPSRSISEAFNVLDEAIDKLEAGDINEPNPTLVKEPSQSQLLASIIRRDPIAVGKVLATDRDTVDVKTLCLAIDDYEPTVFHLLLAHGAQLDGASLETAPLYLAARNGNMDAVRLLLSYRAKEGQFCDSTTAMMGAASGGHLEIVKSLIEDDGANINGDRYKSPLYYALIHHHRHVIDYLLRAGADVFKPRYLDYLNIADILDGCGLDILQTLPRTLFDKLLSLAAKEGDTDAIRRLIGLGAEIEPKHDESPLCLAAKNRCHSAVRCLISLGANVNRRTWSPFGGHELSSLESYHERHGYREHYSLLAAAAITGQVEVARLLSSAGATIFEGEDQLMRFCSYKDNSREEHPALTTVGDFLENIKNHPVPCEDEVDAGDCPMVAAIRDQERRITERRLLAHIASSRERMLEASNGPNASASLKEFARQVGTSYSIYKLGRRAIEDICEGYKSSSIMGVISALQVADAMRAVVPPSELMCSREEFANDIPRWGTLLRQEDRRRFDEIAFDLWGVSITKAEQKQAVTPVCAETLKLLQELVESFKRMYRPFDGRARNRCDSYRLQDLRQKHTSERRHTHACGERLHLADRCLLRTKEVQGGLHTDSSKPQESKGEVEALIHITFLMAGAIFGAIVLFFCQFKDGFSILCLSFLPPDIGQGLESNQIMARNCVIFAEYIGSPELVNSVHWKISIYRRSNSPPDPSRQTDTSPMEGVQEHIVAAQSSYEGDETMFNSHRMIDAVTEDVPADCSPSLASHPATSPFVTSISPSIITTATPSSTITDSSEDGSIPCKIPSCRSKFKLGVNGRTGQASNLQKHMNRYHSKDAVMHECAWECGKTDRNKSNIKAHEEKHCKKRKREHPGHQGKRKYARRETS